METVIEGSSFYDLGLKAELCQVVAELGYEVPTPIQRQSIPVLLAGKDLIGQAQTGTGKTAAFALPLLSKLDFSLEAPQLLVLTPTRELAIQVAEAFKSYAKNYPSFHVLPIYGGQSIVVQLRQLKRQPQVIVGTPGRVMDHLRRKSLSLSALKALVVDEADEMLSMGFLEDIEWILKHTPETKQTTLFSATMPKAVRAIAQTYLKEAVEVSIQKVASEDALIEQSFWFVSGIHKLDALTRILEASDFDAVLVFVRTKTATIELAERLEARGYSAGALNGDMSQDIRERTIDRFKKGRLDILVATDVAARGLHVERISHVINFDIPFDAETYTHRIGRTGRAGRSGTAILFVSSRERGLLRTIERGAGLRMEPFRMPSRADISQLKNDRLKAKISVAAQGSGLDEYEKLVEDLIEETGISPKRIAAALCTLLHDDFQKTDIQKTAEPTNRSEMVDAAPEFSRRPPSQDRGNSRPRLESRRPSSKSNGSKRNHSGPSSFKKKRAADGKGNKRKMSRAHSSTN